MNEDGTPRSGIKFGNFEVLANQDGTPLLLGGGAYGKTYKSVHSFLGTVAALKVIHDSFAYDSGVRKRFLGDAKSLARLTHPHIVKIIDCGEEDGQLYYAMEYCDGGDLEKLAATRGALSDETVLLLGKQAAKALAYVHEQGWLHRDLKPSNFMLAMVSGQNEANLKLIDFGLVKALGQDNAGGMTQTGQFLGTLLFASPEQLREEELDERTDVFSLGLTLWFLLEGKLPFKGKPAQVVAQRLSGQSYHDSLPKEAHAVVKTLLDKMMHPDRDQRFRDMRAVLSAIEQALSELHGTGLIALPKDPKPTAAVGADETPHPSKVGLVTSNQRLGTRYELGEEDKEIQTDLGLRCRARQLPEGDAVHLTIVRKILAADTMVVQHLDQMVVKASTCGGRFLIRPLAFVQFLDQLALAEEYVEGLSLLSVLRIKRALTLPESSPILRQLAEACDLAKTAGITTLELVAHRVLFQFPRQIVASLSGGGVERLISKPVSQWPPFLVRLAPAYTSAQKSVGSSTLGNGGNMSIHGGATMVGSDEDADSPQRFARLVYRILSGHPLPVAAMMSKSAYVPIPRLSEEGNRLLAEVICSEMQVTDCLSLLSQLWRLEGLPETSLSLPKAFDELTNVKAASAGVDVQVPTRPQGEASDMPVIHIDLGPAKQDPPKPKTEGLDRLPTGAEPLPRERPAKQAPVAKQPPPPQPKPRAKEEDRRELKASQPPPVAKPKPVPDKVPIRVQVTPVALPEEGWIKLNRDEEAVAPSTGAKARPPGPALPPPTIEGTRAPHLPPAPPSKPFPMVLVASISAAVLVLGVVGWLARDFFKGDPLKSAMEKYIRLEDEVALEGELLDWVDSQPGGPTEENALRAAGVWTELSNSNKLGRDGKEDEFRHRHELFQRLAMPELAEQELSRGKLDDLKAAWRIAAEKQQEGAAGVEARLKLAKLQSANASDVEWLEKNTAAVPEAQAAEVADVLKGALDRALQEKKPGLIQKIAILWKAAQGGQENARLAWDVYSLYAVHGLFNDPNAVRSLEVAAKDLILIKSLPPGQDKQALIRQAARLQTLKGMELYRLYMAEQMKADAAQVLAQLIAAGDEEAVKIQEDEMVMRGSFEEAWPVQLKRAKAGDVTATDWIAAQSDANLVTKAVEVRPILEALLASGTAKDKAALAAKVAGVMRVTDQGQRDLPWRLYQHYTQHGLTDLAKVELLVAQKSDLPQAWKAAATMATGDAAVTAWQEVARRFPAENQEAVAWLTDWAGKLNVQDATAEIQQLATSVRDVLMSVAPGGEAVSKLDGFLIKRQLMTVTNLAMTDSLAAIKEAHRLARQPGPAQQDAVKWLYSANIVTAKQALSVDDPLVPGAVLPVKGEDWIPGKSVSAKGSDGEMRYFTLPSPLPGKFASVEGSKPPATGDGTLENPYVGGALSVARQMWYPKAVVKDELGRPVVLPDDLPLLVAMVTNDQITDPFTGEAYELKDWSLWKRGGVLGESRPFKLPESLPTPERVVDVNKVDVQLSKVTSPFTQKQVDVPGKDWKSGGSVVDTSDPALVAIGARIILPSVLPMRVALLGGAPGEVIDPRTGDTLKDMWEFWKDGAIVTETQGKGSSAKKVEVFKMPQSVPDPKLPGMNPDGDAHTIVSPYSKKTVTVPTRDIWEKGEYFSDPDFDHLTLKVPTGAPEWFEPKPAELVAGTYLKVISPYTKMEIPVSVQNWNSNEVREPGTNKLAYMPKVDPEVKLVEVDDPFSETFKNPYTQRVETWKGSWQDGAVATWAGKFQMKLPSPLPDRSARMAKSGNSLTQVRNPWNEEEMISVTYSDWNNGRTKDRRGRPIDLGSPPRDPKLSVTLRTGSKQFTNPYTERDDTWTGSSSKGATMKWGKFTIVAEDVVSEINGVPMNLQRTFMTRRNGVLMKWNPAGFWASSPGAVLPGGDPDEFCEDLTSVSRSGGQIPKNFVFRHVGNGKLECRPK